MIRIFAVGATAVCTLAGCAQLAAGDSLFGFVTPYRMEIVQGNVVTQDMLDRVKPGMPRRQVLALLGSPLVADAFHADRWDYVFTIRRQGAAPQRRAVTAYFDGDRLARIEAPEDLPSERAFVASITPPKTFPERKLELTEEERKALPVPPGPEASAAEPVGPVREYPPLEPS